MARLWNTTKDAEARAKGDSTPNVKALENAVKQIGQWSVDEVLTELGGTGRDASHRLAEKILDARGLEINKKSLASQQRAIQRWIAYEKGTGAQARKPNAESQKILNRIGRNAQAARDGFDVAMSGDIEVSGYRRSNRSATIHLEGQAALDFLEEPSYEKLGEAYTGDSHFAGYGDVSIDIQL